MKNLNDSIRNLTHELPACSAISQPTATTRASIPNIYLSHWHDKYENLLALCGPCIVIYLRNMNQTDPLSFLIYSIKYPLHVSNRLTIHNQEAVYCTCNRVYGIYRASTLTSCWHDHTLIVFTASQRGRTIHIVYCIYSKLPPEDEYLISSKHVENIYWNKLRKKVDLVGSYYTNEDLLRKIFLFKFI